MGERLGCCSPKPLFLLGIPLTHEPMSRPVELSAGGTRIPEAEKNNANTWVCNLAGDSKVPCLHNPSGQNGCSDAARHHWQRRDCQSHAAEARHAESVLPAYFVYQAKDTGTFFSHSGELYPRKVQKSHLDWSDVRMKAFNRLHKPLAEEEH